jgi:hypothetical protein
MRLATLCTSSYLLGVTVATSVLTPTPSLTTLIARETSVATPSPAQTTGVDFITTEHITIAGETNAYHTQAAKTIEIAIPTCIQTITPDPNGHVPPGTCGALWDYYPSFVAALIFTGIFGVLTITHVYQAVKLRKVQPMHKYASNVVTNLDFRRFVGSLSWGALGNSPRSSSAPSAPNTSKALASISSSRSSFSWLHCVRVHSVPLHHYQPSNNIVHQGSTPSTTWSSAA